VYSYGNWVGTAATSEILSYGYLKDSNIFAIQYGADISTPSSTNYCLVFYDLTLLKYSPPSSNGFSLAAMLASPLLIT